MKATVKIPFDGCEDGEVHPRPILRGEVVTGDLARAAIDGGFAEEEKSKKPGRNKMLHTPENKSSPFLAGVKALFKPTAKKPKSTRKS